MTTRKIMIAVGVIAVVLSLPRRFWLPVTIIGDGFVDVPLVFLVVDEATGYPVESASIRFPHHRGAGGHLPVGDLPLVATTGRDGRAKIALDTNYSEGVNPLFRVYRHVNYLEDLRVSAQQY